MIALETVKQLQEAPIRDRIKVFEIILESLKRDIAEAESSDKLYPPFKVSEFDLGEDVACERNEMYADRV